MGITFFIMAIGIFLAYRISSLITKPISRLLEATQSIQRGNFSTHIDVKTKDEIGLLASAFNEMTLRLNQMVEEIKRLSTFKERNRIALDLHDGCAQDLANIIKRLELCERLFKIEPMKAIEELRILRENTKEILYRTRQVIFNLKSPEDDKFELMDKLTAYIKDYESSNDIKVKLYISGPLSNISVEKAKSIFYIITETLTNIKKHAQAKNVELNLESDSEYNLKINIKDDGKGFDINATKLSTLEFGKWGLIGMQQRAASLGGILIINSIPNQGTEISVNILLAEKIA